MRFGDGYSRDGSARAYRHPARADAALRQAMSRMPVFFTRKVQGESPRYFEAGANWGNAFRAHVIRAAPLSIVMSAACVRASGRLKMPRTAHWLTPFLTLPTASVSTNR